jgi:hypothetical protein
MGFDTHKTMSEQRAPPKRTCFVRQDIPTKSTDFVHKKFNNQDMTSQSCCNSYFRATRGSRENSNTGANCTTHGLSQETKLFPCTNSPGEWRYVSTHSQPRCLVEVSGRVGNAASLDVAQNREQVLHLLGIEAGVLCRPP